MSLSPTHVFQSISTDNKTKLLVVRCLLMLCDTSFTSTNQKSPSEQVKLTPEQLNRQYEALKYIDRLRDLNINMSVSEFAVNYKLCSVCNMFCSL